MSVLIDRRTFLQGMGLLLASGLAGCGAAEPEAVTGQEPEADREEPTSDDAQPADNAHPAEVDATLLAWLPLTLSIEELHGNEKYCYAGGSFGGEAYVPDTIEAGDLMVFGSDCLVLFFEIFSNEGWSYARVGKDRRPVRPC